MKEYFQWAGHRSLLQPLKYAYLSVFVCNAILIAATIFSKLFRHFHLFAFGMGFWFYFLFYFLFLFLKPILWFYGLFLLPSNGNVQIIILLFKLVFLKKWRFCSWAFYPLSIFENTGWFKTSFAVWQLSFCRFPKKSWLSRGWRGQAELSHAVLGLAVPAGWSFMPPGKGQLVACQWRV